MLSKARKKLLHREFPNLRDWFSTYNTGEFPMSLEPQDIVLKIVKSLHWSS